MLCKCPWAFILIFLKFGGGRFLEYGKIVAIFLLYLKREGGLFLKHGLLLKHSIFYILSNLPIISNRLGTKCIQLLYYIYIDLSM